MREASHGPLTFKVLGSLKVDRDGAAVSITRGVQTRVLQLLLSRFGQPMPVCALIDAVWAVCPPAHAKDDLQVQVSRLRRKLGRDRIVREGAGYLVVAGPGEVDALEFATEIEAAQRAVSANRSECAAEHLDRALGLWRGRPYSDDADGCPVLAAESSRLTELYLDAVAERAEIGAALGRPEELLPLLDRLTTEHPTRQRLVGAQMSVLAAAGRTSEALEVYAHVCEVMDERYAGSPGPALQECHRRIAQGIAPGVDGTAPAGSEPSLSPVPAQLPVSPAGFVVRECELSRLDRAAETARDRDEPVVCTVTGLAGVGKTTLVVHWAHRAVDLFPDGQLFVDLRGFGADRSALDPTDVIGGFLEGFRIRLDQVPLDSSAQASLFRGLLRNRRVLLVLDNARDADQVRPLLPGSAGCLVIVTSRTSMSGLGDRHTAFALDLDVFSAADARRFLAARVDEQRLRTEPDAVERFVTVSAGLPLALAIIASRAREKAGSSLASLAAELTGEGGSLDAFTVFDQSSDLGSVFSWSYDCLSREARRLFRLLGMAPGPDWSPAAAANLAGVTRDRAGELLGELVRANLIRGQAGRYRFHDLLRRYALELAGRIDTPADGRDAIDRMLVYLLGSLCCADRMLKPVDPTIIPAPARTDADAELFADAGRARAWFDAEHAVLSACFDYAVDNGLDRQGADLASAMLNTLQAASHWYEVLRIGQRALSLLERLDDRAGAGYVHRHLCSVLTRLGRADLASAHAERALELCAEDGDPIGRAHTHQTMARLLEMSGRTAEAIGHVRRALELYTTAGSSAGRARAHNGLGWCHAQRGEHGLALEHCREALALARSAKMPYLEAAVLDSLGYILHHLGEHLSALSHYQQSLRLRERLDDPGGRAETLIHIGDTQIELGDTAWAHRCWQQALELLTRHRLPGADELHDRLTGIERS